MNACTKALLSCLMLLTCVLHGQRASALQSLETEGSATLAEARASMNKHQWQTAETQLRRYVTQHQDDPEALFALALTLFYENRPKDSLAMYTRAAANREPTAKDFHYIAFDFVLLHDYVDADTWITRAAREDPDNGEIAYAMGRFKCTENRFDEALTSCKRALVLMARSVKVSTE